MMFSNFEEMGVFLLMIFICVFALVSGTAIPVFGEAGRNRKKLRQRLREIEQSDNRPPLASLLREKYLRELSPAERLLETLPGMENLANMIEQAGRKWRAYQLIGVGIALGFGLSIAAWMFLQSPLLAAAAFPVGLLIPIMKVAMDRGARMSKFEEQLPEALDVIKRALRAGHPFNQSLQLVSTEMDDPIATEFGITFADINYGNDLKSAMLGLLERVPSINVMAVVTSVLVQKETGGNLAEILEKISTVIRGRFRLARKIKTLSAEGRLSAWILVAVPFALFVMIMITTPDYLPVLLKEPLGRELIAWGFSVMMVGILWIRTIIRIKV